MVLKERHDSEKQGSKAYLSFKAGHDAVESWKLAVRGAGIKIDTLISEKTSNQGWMAFEIPLPDADEISVDILASVDVKEALNYWSDFSISYK